MLLMSSINWEIYFKQADLKWTKEIIEGQIAIL
jgi:hypothetical protein